MTDTTASPPVHPFAEPAALDAIRTAIADPGQFTPRLVNDVTDGGGNRETIPAWGSRAVPIALAVAGWAIVPDRPDHILEQDEDGWCIEHPPACRTSGRPLAACPMSRLVDAAVRDGSNPIAFGRFVITDVDGRLAFEWEDHPSNDRPT